jgi:hypothetical protein
MKGYTGNSVSPSISLPDPQSSNPEAPGLNTCKSITFASDAIAGDLVDGVSDSQFESVPSLKLHVHVYIYSNIHICIYYNLCMYIYVHINIYIYVYK